MRGLIENLSPENRRISWKVIGGVFAFYVAIMAGATGMLVLHQSGKSVIDRPSLATAAAGRSRSISAATPPLMSVSLVSRSPVR